MQPREQIPPKYRLLLVRLQNLERNVDGAIAAIASLQTHLLNIKQDYLPAVAVSLKTLIKAEEESEEEAK